MSWNTLRTQVASVISTVTDIQEVAGYPKIKFEGYPAAYVVPSDNEGDYETNKENIRTYAFIVRLFYETKDTGIEQALNALEDIVDSVMDKFDEEDLKGSDTRILGMNLPATYMFINVWATPSNWSEIPGENLVMAELRVRVRISIDVT